MSDGRVPADPTANPYRGFVAALASLTADAAELPLGGLTPRAFLAPDPSAGTALVLAPHPDDECLTGALPLRLRRQCRMRVVDVAITLGSNRARRATRWHELAGACGYLGFERLMLGRADHGLERITPATRTQDAAHWKTAVDALAAVIDEECPRVLFFPHEGDWNPTHVGTHLLARDALTRLGTKIDCRVVETEYWGAMTTPNLLVQSSIDEVADLVAATAFHAGEVQRNPYHLRLPAWLQDNVRRGGELVGGVGGLPPAFAFATLYRLGRARGGMLESVAAGRFLSLADDPAGLFV